MLIVWLEIYQSAECGNLFRRKKERTTQRQRRNKDGTEPIRNELKGKENADMYRECIYFY